jgi:carboxymethylenebutenolidase
MAACTPPDQPEPAPTAAPASRIEAPAPAPSAALPTSREVIAESLPYAEIGNELVYGHFAIPVDMIDPLPAIILVHDWYGLDDDIRAVAERLAGDGYIVLAVDLFQGRTADNNAEARDLEIDVVENPRRAEDNLRQAVSFIRVSSGAPSIGIVGYGFGGGWALSTAMKSPGGLDAAVSFYGQVVTDEDDIAEVGLPFLGIFLESDRAVPAQTVRDFETMMGALGKDTEIELYEGVRRGFLYQSSQQYNQKVADEAWQRMLTFLESRLGVSER